MARSPRSLGTLLLALSLTACDVLNPYEQPRPPLPEGYIEQPGDSAAAAWPDPEWWKQFHSDALTQMEQQAMTNNHDLAAAIARVHQADAQVSIASASLLPNVEAAAGATHSYNGDNSTSTGTGSRRHRGVMNAQIQAAYEIDFWGKNRSAAESSAARRDAQEYDRQVVALSISSSVASTYIDLLATRDRLAIAQQNLANAQKTLDTLKKQFRAGTISRLEVAQQASLVAQQNAAIAPLQLRLSQDRNALALLLGVLPEQLHIANDEKLADLAMPSVPAGLPSELLRRRPDVAEAEADLRAAHADINVARASFFPSIGLTGAAGYQSNALNNLFSPGGQLFSFGASLVQPIFEGGSLTGNLEFSKARYDELVHNYYQAALAAFGDTEDALAAVRRNGEQHTAQTEAVAIARDAYGLSQRQFRGGITDITSVLNTQRTLFSAEDGLIQTRQAQLSATVGLYKALGGGWSPDKPDGQQN